MIHTNTLGKLVVWSTALSSGAILFVIAFMLGVILKEGLIHISWEFLTTAPSNGMTGGGVFPL